MGSRRKFIKQSTAAGLGSLFLGSHLLSCKDSGAKGAQSMVQAAIENGFSIDQFGIQLWTVRDFMQEDPKGTLKQLGEYGYKQIESFQGDQGVFWGMDPADFKNYLSDQDMKCVATHCDSNYALDESKRDEFKKLVDDAASIGIEYLVNPYLGGLKTMDEFKSVAAQFNVLGEIAKASGLRYAYHNHHYSFTQIDGIYPQDIMMSESDADLVDFEMDFYWVVTAKEDPIAWLNKYPGRFTLCHIKDRYKPAKVAELENEETSEGGWPMNVSCVLGEGQIDFDEILKVADKQGMKKWLVEQERYDDMTSMEAAEKDADFMEKYVA